MRGVEFFRLFCSCSFGVSLLPMRIHSLDGVTLVSQALLHFQQASIAMAEIPRSLGNFAHMNLGIIGEMERICSKGGWLLFHRQESKEMFLERILG
jgi:hypothetical protein